MEKWKRTLFIMTMVQFLMSLAFTSSLPFTVYFVEQLGVEGTHINIWTGIIIGITPLTAAIASPIWGSLADQKGYKLMVVRSIAAISFFNLLLAFSPNIWVLFIIRTFQGAFTGYTTASITLTGTIVPENKLGYALGWMQSFGTAGALIGPLLGGFASDYFHGNYRLLFMLTTIFALTALVITIFFVKETFQPPSKKEKPSILKQFQAVRDLKALRPMFVVLFLTQFAGMGIFPLLPLFIKQIGENSVYIGTLAGFAIAITGFANLFVAPFIGKQSDKFGYRYTLIICFLGAGIFYLPQILATNIFVFIAARFGLGFFAGGILPTANALIGSLAPKHQRGQIYGLTGSAMLLGQFAGPILFGFSSAWVGIRVMLGFSLFLYVLGAWWVKYRVQEPQTMLEQAQ